MKVLSLIAVGARNLLFLENTQIKDQENEIADLRRELAEIRSKNILERKELESEKRKLRAERESIQKNSVNHFHFLRSYNFPSLFLRSKKSGDQEAQQKKKWNCKGSLTFGGILPNGNCKKGY